MQSSHTTSIVRQSSLMPISLAQPRQIGDVFASEAEWRAALLQAPTLLEQIVGAQVQNLEEEPSVAGYRPDLAFSAGGRYVLVELQLGAGDARHLGQVVRYAGLGDADLVLWLSDEIDPRDAALLDAINQVAGCKVVAVTVHTLLAPSGHVFFPRIVAGAEYQLGRGFDVPASPRELGYAAFWRLLMAALAARSDGIFSGHNPRKQKWIRTPIVAGSGVFARVSLAADAVRVGVQVDSGDEAYNATVWDELVANGQALEAALGGGLELRAPGRTGVLETRVAGGYAVNPEGAARATAEALGRLQATVTEVLEDAGWRSLQAGSSCAPTLF